MKKLMTFAVIAMIAVMVAGMLSTGAWFTDNDATVTDTLKAGNLDLDDAGVSSFELGTLEFVEPGWISDPVTITIKNTGNLNLAWFGGIDVTESILKDVIYVYDAKVEYVSPEGKSWEFAKDGTTILPVDHFIAKGVGVGEWPTVWGGPDNLATLRVFDNNRTMSPGNPYEFMGALKPGYSYKITLQFAFYEKADNTYENAGPMNISFAVDATQLKEGALKANNPPMDGHLGWFNTRITYQNAVP